MLKIGIILGSTRPNRVGGQVCEWVHGIAAARGDAEFEVVDLRDHPLPQFDEPLSPMLGRYQNDHTQAWANTIASYDGFIFITPEYNHGTSAVLKNAIDFLYAEWSNKAVGIISYGVAGGTGAAAQLRQMCGQLGMADVSKVVVLSLHSDFENFTTFKPSEYNAQSLTGLLAQVVMWSELLAPLRAEATLVL